MKKILLGLSVILMTSVSAQNYPDYYPNNNSNGYGNGNYYGNEDEDFYFPDDYYYEYPSDYYSNDLYQGYYDNYRQSIIDVNWNRFFTMNRLSSWQVQQIMMLNDSFNSYSAWNSYYRYNPDRWYYDRFYAIQRILGPNLFIVFQNDYYHGYSPILYYQNYNRRHYARNVYVIKRYRTVNINIYKVNKVKYHQTNPRQNIGFQPTRSGNNPSFSGSRDNGFRNDGLTADTNTRNNSIRNDNAAQQNRTIRNESGNTRSNSVRIQSQSSSNTNGSRNDASNRQTSVRNTAPRSVESNSGSRSSQNTVSRTSSSSSRNSGNSISTR